MIAFFAVFNCMSLHLCAPMRKLLYREDLDVMASLDVYSSQVKLK